MSSVKLVTMDSFGICRQVVLLLLVISTGAAFGTDDLRAYLKDHEIWIQRSASETAFQATHISWPKSRLSEPIISPNGAMIASVLNEVRNPGEPELPGKLILLDSSGREVQRVVGLQTNHGFECSDPFKIDWIDDQQIGLTCQYSPSEYDSAAEDYLVVDLKLGKVAAVYSGTFFEWSPSRRLLAYVDPDPTIAEIDAGKKHSPRVLINGKPAYQSAPKFDSGSDRSKRSRYEYGFSIRSLTWSPDSTKLAFVEWMVAHDKRGFEVKSQNRAYVLIIGPDHSAAQYRLGQLRDVSLEWLGGSRLRIDQRVYDLATNPPAPIQ
jgi:hypothetical protein